MYVDDIIIVCDGPPHFESSIRSRNSFASQSSQTMSQKTSSTVSRSTPSSLSSMPTLPNPQIWTTRPSPGDGKDNKEAHSDRDIIYKLRCPTPKTLAINTPSVNRERSPLSFTKIRRDRTSSLPLAWARCPRLPRIVHVRFNG